MRLQTTPGLSAFAAAAADSITSESPIAVVADAVQAGEGAFADSAIVELIPGLRQQIAP